MVFLKQLARSTPYSVRVNHKVSMMAATINKQGDVELLNFGLDGSNNFVIDASICCDHIGNSTGNNGHLKCKKQSNDYVPERAGVRIRKYSADYVVVGTAFLPAIVSVTGQIHPCGSWLTNRRDLQPLLVVVMSTQLVQVPVLVLLMMASAPALKVVTLAPVPRATC